MIARDHGRAVTIIVSLTPYNSHVFWILHKILIVEFIVEVNFFCAQSVWMKETVDEQRNLMRANGVLRSKYSFIFSKATTSLYRILYLLVHHIKLLIMFV